MRVAVGETPGWWEWDAFLDGEYMPNAYEVDTDAGYMRVYVKRVLPESDGRAVYYIDPSTGQTAQTTLYGRVELRLNEQAARRGQP